MSLERRSRTEESIVSWYPTDLAVVSVAAILSYYLLIAARTGGVLDLLIAFPLLFVLPGYALVAVCFPGLPRPATPGPNGSGRPAGIDGVERVGLSFAFSLVCLPVTAVLVAPTRWGLDVEVVTLVLSLATVGLAQLGVIRRLNLRPDERFVARPLGTLSRLRGDETGFVATLSSGLLVVAIVTAVLVLTVALAAPLSGSAYSELRLYTDAGDGAYASGGFPEAIDPGESIPVAVDVENREGEPVTYTLVFQEQRVEGGEVLERTELDRTEVHVESGSTETVDRNLTPTTPDGTVRVSVLLYKAGLGDVPGEPTNEDADYDTYFWTTVISGGVADSIDDTGDEEGDDEGTDAEEDEGTDVEEDEGTDVEEDETDDPDDESDTDADDSFDFDDLFG